MLCLFERTYAHALVRSSARSVGYDAVQIGSVTVAEREYAGIVAVDLGVLVVILAVDFRETVRDVQAATRSVAAAPGEAGYREPVRMVAGSVTPPRIDLRNRDLIRSHIHAIWMQTAKPDLGKTLRTVLDLAPDDGRLPLPVTDAIKEELRNPYRREHTRDRAAPVIAEIRSELARTTWFHDEWVDDVLGQVELSFDAACERWRNARGPNSETARNRGRVAS